MPTPTAVKKAQIWHAPNLDLIAAAVSGAAQITLQFNPEKLTISGGPNMDGNKSQREQFVTDSRYTITFDTWFDATASADTQGFSDAWAFVQALNYYRRPMSSSLVENSVPILPTLCFQWGTLLFYGQMTGLSTTMDYFSPDGRPLRASAAVTLEGQISMFGLSGALGGLVGGLVGAATGALDSALPSWAQGPANAAVGMAAGAATSFVVAQAGQSVQQLAGALGGGSWQSVAAANGVENPRMLAAGTVLQGVGSAALGGGLGSALGGAMGGSCGCGGVSSAVGAVGSMAGSLGL